MIDTHSSTWKHIETELTKELERLGRNLEAIHLTEPETYTLRGDIRRIRAILTMPEKIPHNNE